MKQPQASITQRLLFKYIIKDVQTCLHHYSLLKR